MTINFKGIHIKNVISSDFWFSVDPITLHKSDWLLLAVGLILAAVAIALKLAAMFTPHPVTKRLLNRFFVIFLSVGISEGIWFALRYQNARVIGTHTVAVIILLIGLAYTVPILKYLFTRYHNEREAWNKEQLKLKYLKK